MMSNLNKISIPKEIFENVFFAEGGEKKNLFKALTGEYQFALDSKKPMVEPNAEIEGGEYLFDSNGIRKAEGKSHDKGGMPVALEDGTRILSDHLKLGSSTAKRINKELGLPVKATDTYAKVLDRFNSKTGLEKINLELESLMGMMKDQKTKVKDKHTSDLNIDYLAKQLYKKTESKKPIEKDREKLFDIMFQIQEESKRKASMPDHKMEMGGVIDSTASKYGISQDRASELLDLPMYQKAGEFVGDGYYQGDNNGDGVVDEKDNLYNDYKQLYNRNRDLLIRSTERSDFTKNPRTVNTLPYTPRDTSSNPIWQGDTYANQWVPLVRTSMSDKAKAKSIDEWLTNNKGKFSPNIQKQLEGLTGDKRYEKIQQLATDSKPGPFHNALLQAMVETTEPAKDTTVDEKKQPDAIDLAGLKKYATLNLPQRIYQTPTLQPSLKVATRLNRVEPSYVSPTQSIAEIDRSVQAAQQNLAGMSDAQRAAAVAGLTANQGAATSKAITEANRANAQAQNAADIYNAKVGDTEQLYENQNALSYEGRTLKGLANYENDWQNLRNTRFNDQFSNWSAVAMANAQNASNPQVQMQGDGTYETNYTPDFGKAHAAELANLKGKLKALEDKSTPVAKFGGRFRKK